MTKQQRLVLVVSILASFVAFLDVAIVNVALPAINKEFGGGLTAQQWIVDAYFITLGSLILIAGSLSDLFGRKRILLAGLLGFAVTSVLCAVAPNNEVLIVSRGLQGISGALLVPSSLALIISSFKGAAQGKAIGTWTSWTGISFIIGPLVGGALVDSGSWRLVFAINVLPIAITLWLMRGLDVAEQVRENTKVDFVGALLCTVGLAAAVFGLIEQPQYGWDSLLILASLFGGLGLLVAFVFYEARTPNAMLPLSLFRVRNFSAGNVATAAIYGALAMATFLIVVFVQQVGGYSALAAGMSLLPITLIMFVLSPRFGGLSAKYGPRLFMAGGPFVMALGLGLMLMVNETVSYWTQLLPGVLLFGLGLSITVAPLTSAILADIDSRHAGVASAVNNAVARIAGLITVAVMGVIVGAQLTLAGFHRGLVAMIFLMLLGAAISAIGIQNPKKS